MHVTNPLSVNSLDRKTIQRRFGPNIYSENLYEHLINNQKQFKQFFFFVKEHNFIFV